MSFLRGSWLLILAFDLIIIRRNTAYAYCALECALPRCLPNVRVQRPMRLYRVGELERFVRLDVCSANQSIALNALLTASAF